MEWRGSNYICSMKVIKTEIAYQKAVKRTITIFQAKEGTPEADELALLLVLIKNYEDKHISTIHPNPITLKAMDDAKKGKTKKLKKAKDLIAFLNKPV